MHAALVGIVSDISLDGKECLSLGMQNANELHSICIAERYRASSQFHSTRCAGKALFISRLSDISHSATNYRVRLHPKSPIHHPSFSQRRNLTHGGRVASIFPLPSSDISPMCQFHPPEEVRKKASSARTLPAASRRARVPPRTRIVGRFGEVVQVE